MKPKNGFPGLNAELSNAAWASGKQPEKLVCWPKDTSGKLKSCKNSKVLEDSSYGCEDSVCCGRDSGNPCFCQNMALQIPTPPSCSQYCLNNPECQTYMENTSSSCSIGLGYQCYSNDQPKSEEPLRLQRIQHGSIRVLMDLTGWQVQGLVRVFPVNGQTGGKPFFGWKEGTDDWDGGHAWKVAAARCRDVCYSDIKCEFWIYSIWYGCWVEDATHANVSRPLTLANADRSSKFAKSARAGQYILHTCDGSDYVSQPDASAMPYCAEPNWMRVEPGSTPTAPIMDLPGTTFTITGDAHLCQERCQQTAECIFWTYDILSGQCHINSAASTMVHLPGPGTTYVTGDKECPVTTPAPQAQCVYHSKCVEEMYTGQCCPNGEGIYLSCCEYKPGIVPGTAPQRFDRQMFEYIFRIHHLDYQTLTPDQIQKLQIQYANIIQTYLPIKHLQRRLSNQSLTSDTGRRLSTVGEHIVYSWTHEPGKVSLAKTVGFSTDVKGFLSMDEDDNPALFEENVASPGFANLIVEETMCVVCPPLCRKEFDPRLRDCPQINGKLSVEVLSVKEMPMWKWLQYDGSTPWWSTWWGILLQALILISCCCACFFAVRFCNKPTKHKGMYHEDSQSEMEPPSPKSTSQFLPFPEAPPDDHLRLPFPKAGLSSA
jgi:hypothetical protein